ncbi:MAG: pirin-like C-terminal cupin domain-containing protein [Acidobacteriota bacterium]
MKTNRSRSDRSIVLSEPIRGRSIQVGDGFAAQSFAHKQFDGPMDPLVLVDHFTMSEPTFGAHAHAGMSAVSVLFEDSVGHFRNRDSLGVDVDLGPGDLYWLKAGRGAVHDEAPRVGARTHALQIFVNLPAAARLDAPESLLVRADEMPELRADRYRVRVVLGESNEVSGLASPALPLTILDAHLEAGGAFAHVLPERFNAWIHAIRGEARIVAGDSVVGLAPGDALAVRGNDRTATLKLLSEAGAQLVLLQGEPLGERFVQRGPFVMSTTEELDAVAAAYEAGELGSLSGSPAF